MDHVNDSPDNAILSPNRIGVCLKKNPITAELAESLRAMPSFAKGAEKEIIGNQ
jgi:hypothetical protein